MVCEAESGPGSWFLAAVTGASSTLNYPGSRERGSASFSLGLSADLRNEGILLPRSGVWMVLEREGWIGLNSRP